MKTHRVRIENPSTREGKAMTKKHFKAIAEIISKRSFKVLGVNTIQADFLVSDLNDYFASINPNFDRSRFEVASRGKEA
jgi:hypothetical protein